MKLYLSIFQTQMNHNTVTVLKLKGEENVLSANGY